MDEQAPKPRRTKRDLPEWTAKDAQEFADTYRESYDQWEILKEILDYATLLIKNPSQLPPHGFVRLFNDIYAEYEGLEISQLQLDQIDRLNKKIVRFNVSLRLLRPDSLRLLQENGITIKKLATLSAKRD